MCRWNDGVGGGGFHNLQGPTHTVGLLRLGGKGASRPGGTPAYINDGGTFPDKCLGALGYGLVAHGTAAGVKESGVTFRIPITKGVSNDNKRPRIFSV